MGAIIQTGLVACTSVDDYQGGVIKKHELTRPDKEEDRVRHIDYLNANDEPVFYSYKNDPSISEIIDSISKSEPEYDFTTDDDVAHTVWVVRDAVQIELLTAKFANIPTLYVADGHHRSAAASRVRELRKNNNPDHTGNEEYNFFLTVIFPDNELNIMPYNRVVKNLNDRTITELSRGENFCSTAAVFIAVPRHESAYLDGKWVSADAAGAFSDGVARQCSTYG
jgi:uncharacterized protein (DUF1015 family)